MGASIVELGQMELADNVAVAVAVVEVVASIGVEVPIERDGERKSI